MLKKTHCKRGHEFTPDNTYTNPKTKYRVCLSCRQMQFENRMFGGNRETAITRDGEKCVKCGITRVEHRKKYDRDITVDHIDKRGSKSPAEEKNNDMSNLQTLCLVCHGRKDTVMKKISPSQAVNIKHVKGSFSSDVVAELYGVTRDNINRIWRKDTWGVDGKPKVMKPKHTIEGLK